MQILLAIHIVSAVVFVGNMIISAFWKVRADRSGSTEAMANASRSLLWADIVFTVPGLVGLLVTGIWMVNLTGWERFQEPWLGISLVLLVLTAVIWAAGLLPLQLRMARLARLQSTNTTSDPAYRRSSKIWSMLGGIATLMPVVILFLMVLRPGA
ncbi:MAG: hypothetical protein BZY88_02740 [SAR202 cluster bacterium Io17-Chloro-G9]|nr:MAG: hypothetical protein BZY88_02740 [SAR202 cluster bacterium Io17-Chloro-G9]